MSITLTANYKEVLNAHTVEFIDERLEDNYALDDMLEFIDEFAEDFYNDTMDVPDCLVIDWEATWDQNLRYDFTACNDGSSYRPCHIFSDN